jgi:hypothetical protein
MSNVVEPWYVDCIQETVPIFVLIFIIWCFSIGDE